MFLIDLQTGQTQAAEKVLDQAAKAGDTSAEFCAGLADLYANLLRQAPSLKTAITSNARGDAEPGGDDAIAQSAGGVEAGGRLFTMLGDTTNAAKIYLKLINNYSEIPLLRNEVRLKLAEIYLQGQDSTNAAAQLKAIADDDPGNGQVYYLLGRLAYDDRRLPEAEDYFHRTLLLSEDNQDAYFKLAEVQIDLQHTRQAVATLKKEREKFGTGFISRYLMALAYVEEKNFTNAVNEFTGGGSDCESDRTDTLTHSLSFRIMIGEYESIFVFVKMITLLETRRFSKKCLRFYGSRKTKTTCSKRLCDSFVLYFFRTKLIILILFLTFFGDDATTFFMTIWRSTPTR